MSARIDFKNPETVHRGLLWHLKKNPDEANTEAAEAFLASFKFSIFIDSKDANDSAYQICLLTLVNVASRIAIQPNSVQIFGVNGQRRNDNSELLGTLEDAVNEVGGTCKKIHRTAETLGIIIGNAEALDCKFLIRAVFEGWRGGIVPCSHPNPFDKNSAISLGAILAAGLAIYECFRFINNEGSAIGYRKIGMSLWDLGEMNWTKSSLAEPQSIDSISPIWFCGLGHLGQAYIWILGHLPISDELKCSNQITIQDEDLTSESNLSTSLLTSRGMVDVAKTHICNNWLKDRGFREVVVVERYITPSSKIDFGCSQLVCGFDKRKPRRQAALRNPILMIDGGIGGRIDDFQNIVMTVLPSDIKPQKRWAGDDDGFDRDMPSSLKMHHDSGDEVTKCGIETLNGKAVGFPFVGVVTASIIMAELLRRNMIGLTYQSISLDMRNLDIREIRQQTP